MPSMQSPAKLNLFLEVTEKRPDGFHNLESVFLAIDLADSLSAELDGTGAITLACDYPGLPRDSRNLVVRAAETLRRVAGMQSGIRFVLNKRIPPGSGLGGGSSNAATALRLANQVWQCGLRDDELARLAPGLGSDVPFFFKRGACLCRGRGEIVTPLPFLLPNLRLAVVLPDIHSNTAEAFRDLSLPGPGERISAEQFLEAMVSNDANAMAARAFNRFEATVFRRYPPLGQVRRKLAEAGLRARLSGSGSALWLFGTAAEATHALAGDPQLSDWLREGGLRVVDARPYAGA